MLEKNIKVSIVDDNIELIRNLSLILDSEPGIKLVETYHDAETAESSVPNNPCDILIVDINLPGANGIELIKSLVKQEVSTQFMVYTIHDGNEYLFEALTAGASGYILKGASPLQITNYIKLMHDGGAPMTPSIARKVISYFNDQSQKTAEPLTRREIEVLKYLNQGYTYNEVAAELDISRNTVHTHIKKIYEKLRHPAEKTHSEKQNISHFFNFFS